MHRFTLALSLALTALVGCVATPDDPAPESLGEAVQPLLELGEVCDPNADPWRCCSGVCEKDANLPNTGRCVDNKWQCGCASQPPCP